MGNALEGLLAFTAGGVSKAAKQVRENELLEIERKETEQNRRLEQTAELQSNILRFAQAMGTGVDPQSVIEAMSRSAELVKAGDPSAAFQLLETQEKVESPKDAALTAFREQQTETSKSREDFNKAKTAKLDKDKDLNKIKAGLTSTNAEIDDTRQKISGLNVTLKDLRIRKNDLNKLAFAGDDKLEFSGQTKDDRTQARLDLKQIKRDEAQVKLDIKNLERSLSSVGSQRDALQKKLGIPETPESRNLERILKLERDPDKAFQLLNKDPAIKNKVALIRQASRGGSITKEGAVKRFVELFLEAIQRGSVSQQLMQSLAEEFVETL